VPRHDVDGRQDRGRGGARDARRVRGRRPRLHRHGGRVRRRRRRTHAEAVARASPRRGGRDDEGALPGHRPGRGGPGAGTHTRGLRGEPAPPRDRRHRPLRDPCAGRERAARGRPRRTRRSGACRQGPSARRLELPRLAARVGAAHAGRRRLGPVRRAPGAVLARRTVGGARSAAPRSLGGNRAHPMGPVGRGLSHRASHPGQRAGSREPPGGGAGGRRGGGAPPNHRAQSPARRRAPFDRRRARRHHPAGRDRLALAPAGRDCADHRATDARAVARPAPGGRVGAEHRPAPQAGDAHSSSRAVSAGRAGGGGRAAPPPTLGFSDRVGWRARWRNWGGRR
jgi:hypothetical protein